MAGHLDTNLTGVWNTMVACAPHLIAARGGSMICTSSTAGIKGLPFLAPYVAAKHGVVGIARTMANELAQHRIRVNTVHPTGVNTPMVEGLGGLDPLIERDPNLGPIFVNTLPVEAVEARDIGHACFSWPPVRPNTSRPGVHRGRRQHDPVGADPLWQDE